MITADKMDRLEWIVNKMPPCKNDKTHTETYLSYLKDKMYVICNWILKAPNKASWLHKTNDLIGQSNMHGLSVSWWNFPSAQCFDSNGSENISKDYIFNAKLILAALYKWSRTMYSCKTKA